MSDYTPFFRLGPLDRQRTVFHCWFILEDGRNPLRDQGEIALFKKKVKDSAFRYGVRIVDMEIMDNHIHMILACGTGPRNIAKFWKSVNTYLALKAKKLGIEGKIAATPVYYNSIPTPRDLLKTLKYLHENGKRDGHFVLYSTANEYRFMNFFMVDIDAGRMLTGIEMDDFSALSDAPMDKFLKLLARYDSCFKKKLHLYQLPGKKK